MNVLRGVPRGRGRGRPMRGMAPMQMDFKLLVSQLSVHKNEEFVERAKHAGCCAGAAREEGEEKRCSCHSCYSEPNYALRPVRESL